MQPRQHLLCGPTPLPRIALPTRRIAAACCYVLVFWTAGAFNTALAHPGAGIVIDRQGQVFFVNGVHNQILKLDRDGTVAVFFEDREGKRLSNPHHLVLDREGQIYSVGDRSTPVLKFGPDGRPTQVYPPSDWYGITFIGTGGDPFTLDDQGNLYCLNSRQLQHTQILRITPDGRIANWLGGLWGTADGKGDQAQFRDLHSSCFAWGPGGVLYLTDTGCCIRKVSPDGIVTTWAGSPSRGFADARGTAAKFGFAIGLAFDAQGNCYVADAGNHRIRKVLADGTVSTIAGSGRPGSKDGPVAEATFETPSGVAVDGEGNLWVLEHAERTRKIHVRKISGQRVTTVATVDE